MAASWAQFEAILRQALGKDDSEDVEGTKETTSASTLNRNDQFLFGSGSVSNLVVVACHICNSLVKPAFLSHHIAKRHGKQSLSVDATCDLASSKESSSESKKCINKLKARLHRSDPKECDPIKVKIKYDGMSSSAVVHPVTKPVKPKPKAKGSKRKNDVKNKKDLEGIKDNDIASLPSFKTSSPPPSPPPIYPTPSLTKSNKRSRHSGSKESKQDAKGRFDLFDFKSLVKNLPMLPNDKYYHNQESSSIANQLGVSKSSTCRRKPRPLVTQQYNCRSIGSGEVVFTRRSDNLIASLSALVPDLPKYKCNSEIKYKKSVTENGVLSDAAGSNCADDVMILNSFTQENSLSPSSNTIDKIFDILDSNIFDKSFQDDIPTDWTDLPDPPIRNKPYQVLSSNAPPYQIRPNIPKLKVDTNQIRSNSAMSVFDFDDLEDSSRHDEERAQLLSAGGTASNRKNKRKMVRSPVSQKPVSNAPDLNSSPVPSNKRGKYEVIELDRTPSPIKSPSLKQQFVTSPRQFSFMLGYNEQTT